MSTELMDGGASEDFCDPLMRHHISRYRGSAMPSADARYMAAKMTGTARYRLTGKLGNAPHINIPAHGDVPPLESFDLASSADADGNISVIVGGDEQPGAWMDVSPEAGLLFFREYFADWEDVEYSHLVFERIDGDAPSKGLTADSMSDMLETVISTIESRVPFWKGLIGQIRDSHDNTVDPPIVEPFGLGDIMYGRGWFNLQADEALIIEVDPPECVHWSFQLGNYWGEWLDVANFTCSLNGEQAITDSDGTYRLVIAREDPGVANWLDPAGHREGIIYSRFHLPEGQPVQRDHHVKLSELFTVVPEDTRRVTPAERTTAVDARRHNFVRRWSPWPDWSAKDAAESGSATPGQNIRSIRQ